MFIIKPHISSTSMPPLPSTSCMLNVSRAKSIRAALSLSSRMAHFIAPSFSAGGAISGAFAAFGSASAGSFVTTDAGKSSPSLRSEPPFAFDFFFLGAIFLSIG